MRWRETERWPWDQLVYDGETKPECWVALEERESDELRITVYQNRQPTTRIGITIDQWGTWLLFDEDEPLVVAQEDGTRAFLPAYIAALTRLKERLGG